MKLSRDAQRNDIPLDAFSAAFDEPLSKQEVLAIAITGASSATLK